MPVAAPGIVQMRMLLTQTSVSHENEVPEALPIGNHHDIQARREGATHSMRAGVALLRHSALQAALQAACWHGAGRGFWPWKARRGVEPQPPKYKQHHAIEWPGSIHRVTLSESQQRAPRSKS